MGLIAVFHWKLAWHKIMTCYFCSIEDARIYLTIFYCNYHKTMGIGECSFAPFTTSYESALKQNFIRPPPPPHPPPHPPPPTPPPPPHPPPHPPPPHHPHPHPHHPTTPPPPPPHPPTPKYLLTTVFSPFLFNLYLFTLFYVMAFRRPGFSH